MHNLCCNAPSVSCISKHAVKIRSALQHHDSGREKRLDCVGHSVLGRDCALLSAFIPVSLNLKTIGNNYHSQMEAFALPLPKGKIWPKQKCKWHLEQFHYFARLCQGCTMHVVLVCTVASQWKISGDYKLESFCVEFACFSCVFMIFFYSPVSYQIYKTHYSLIYSF